MSNSEAVEIRSYRKVFDLERRIYKIDRLRLNPGGVPVRGVAYFLLALLAMLVLGALPFTRLLTHVLPWYMRDLGIPACLAAVMGIIRVEGRPFHIAAMSLARFTTSPKHLSGLRPCEPHGRRWYLSELLFLPDGSDSRLRSMRFTGPGAALINVTHERALWHTTVTRRSPRLTLRPIATQRPLPKGQVIELRRGVCLHVHGSPPAHLRLRGVGAARPDAHAARSHSSRTRTGERGCDRAHQTAPGTTRLTHWTYE